MLDEVVGTVVGRWYVTAFGVVFLVCAVRQFGARKALTYLAAATVFGAIAENASVHLGIPYTRYAFNENLKGDELFVGDVPLMVPLSYSFMAYFAFASGRLLASGPFRTRALRPWHEYLVAVMLAVWAVWILDPVSRLGEHFYLGELFRYEGPGFWFGLPTASQFGFTATMAALVGALAWLDRAAPDVPVDGIGRHPHLTALLTYHGQVFHLAGVAFYVAWRNDLAVADTLGGSAILMWVPAAVLTAVQWSRLRIERERAAGAEVRGAARENITA